MSAPFLIIGLPRSRTAWLSNFLTHGSIFCHHELVGRDGLDSLWTEFQYLEAEFIGNSDTLQVMYLDEIMGNHPECKIVVVKRHPADVCLSMSALGFRSTYLAVTRLLPHVHAAALLPGALSVNFEDLSKESTMRSIQDHVAPGEPFDSARHSALQRLNVQLTKDEIMNIKRLAGQMERTGT